METLVVYESKFGNTEQIACAIAERVRGRAASVAKTIALDVEQVDLLVVGGPTQAHGVSPGVRAFLSGLPPHALEGVRAASFDTRLPKSRLLTGAASHGLAKLLKHRGAVLVAKPESFLVAGTEGPLVEGELERARAWAAAVAEKTEAISVDAQGSPVPVAGAVRRAFAHSFPVPLITIRPDTGRMEERLRPEEEKEEERRAAPKP